MMAELDDKAGAQAQRLAWEALKKSINGLINKVGDFFRVFGVCGEE
jgi:hypothetical protein